MVGSSSTTTIFRDDKVLTPSVIIGSRPHARTRCVEMEVFRNSPALRCKAYAKGGFKEASPSLGGRTPIVREADRELETAAAAVAGLDLAPVQENQLLRQRQAE